MLAASAQSGYHSEHQLSWQSLYDSAWQHPGVAFICGGLLTFCVLLFRARRRSGSAPAQPGGRLWALLFLLLQIEILLDAALTGALSPLASGSGAATFAATLFVILGDLRYFYLFERQLVRAHRPGPGLGPWDRTWAALRVALPISLLLPAATGVAARLFPEHVSGNRLFLGYEIGFLLLASAHAWLRRSGHGLTMECTSYVRRLYLFELVQYALWVISDALIITGHDLGWGLRMLPNLLYYAAFVPVAVFTAPPQAQP